MSGQPSRTRTQLALGGEIATKLLDPDLASGIDERFRLVREVMAAASIQSSHVVRILDHGFSTGGRCIIVMERLRGEDLAQRLSRVGRMTPDELLSVLTPACAGLTAGHALGIVHRNVEPGNLFLHEAEGSMVVKLLNFGITPNLERIADARASERGPLQSIAPYSSPEQGLGRAIDARSDLYSMALVAYRCLAGRTPFAPGEAHGQGSAADLLPPTPPSTFNPTLSTALDEWFAAMLRADPNTRLCQSAAELAHSFAAACGKPNPYARSPPVSIESLDRLGAPDARIVQPSPVGRHRRIRKTLAGACSVAIAGATLWLVRRQPETSSNPEPSRTATPAPVRASPSAIRLHLSVFPREARVTLDGQQLPSNPYSSTRPADEQPHRLRAEAPGYASIEREITLAGDVTLELSLAALHAAPPSAASVAAELKEVAPPAARTNRAAPPSRRASVPIAAPSSSEAAVKSNPARKLPLNVDRSNPWQEP